jgi:O-antigen/teichoic acid export membrane protein
MKRLINILGESGFLFFSTLVVNIGNYGLNLLLGRFLGPSEFAAANIIATLVLVLSFIALGVQLATTKFISEYNAEGAHEMQAAFIGWMKRAALIFSVTISFVLVITSPAIASFLNFRSATPLVILFVAIPIYINLCVSRGYFQGKSQFKKLAHTYLAEMIGRLIMTTVLVFVCYTYELSWVIEAIAIGFIASFVVAAYFGKVASTSLFKVATFTQSRQLYVFLAIVAMYEFSQIIINNSDVLLVKHYFENKEAGLYASLALIGRVVFFATWSIVTVLFPKIIEKEKKGEPHAQYFWGSLSIVGLFGIGITLGCYFLGDLVVSIMFGEAYLSTASLLWQYAIATTLFSCANVFVYYHMSLENYIPVVISLIVGILQVVGIFFFHESMLEIIHVQIAVMGLMLTAMIIYQQFYSKRKYKKVGEQSPSLILNHDIS